MIIQKFEQEVEKNPNRIAIKTLENGITYKVLNNYANVLAKEIIGNYNTINPREKKKIAALLFEHDKDMIIGTIGALKAQTIYVPLDPSYPTRRLIYMLENSEADFIVTNDKNLELAICLIEESEVDIRIINVDQIDIECSTENINRKVSIDDIAYILYTSGSTGNPKGIFQTHRNVLHFIQCYKNTLSITNEDRMTLFSAFSHDASIMDIYGALLNGATLYPLNIKSQVGIDKIANWLEEEKITIWHSVPTVYRYFINALTGTEKFSTLRFIVLGGENVILHDVEMFQRIFANAKLVNLYGQTESSFNSAQIYSVDSKVKKVMLGEAVQETEILVVNENREEVFPLEVGEIVILSDYVALGYWKDEEKSREVFQYSSEVGRTYWTGDLGKLLADGSIEFVGRKGSQVKIRGYRIEVEEIENNLLENEFVKETVVLGRKDTDGYDYLCAYIVSDKKLTTSYLGEYLSERVPDYMIPSFFVQLDKIPVTPNGKVDRKALSELDRSIATVSEYEAPRNEIEEKLSTIWKEVLKVDRVGINDNFFELGGHSLKAISIAEKTYKQLDIKIPITQILNKETIKEITMDILDNEFIEYLEKITRLNDEKDKKVFAFPPIIGYGVTFKGLANIINSHSVYAFNFIESENRIKEYVDLIIDVQKEGPYILMGYSAGGKLAFEVAKELENQGYEVSDIILIDSGVKEMSTIGSNDNSEIIENVERFMSLEAPLMWEYINESVKRKTYNYSLYFNKLINEGKVNANIYQVSCSNEDVDDELIRLKKKWKDLTTKYFVMYEGNGKHGNMLEGDYCEKNAQIIKEILISLE
ncbi:amino acid adenylation domain-containing protein [Clostridium sp. UBA6640]|uniref:non-ribosomal peptide synthetase family protein n=1 Tax=Clostridium sp. UBA6640 TaxID=1946370 RepID=UPI0025C11F92|nr:amino acid adenylation domain-containing protein [Clostridium sp. UBA6640]